MLLYIQTPKLDQKSDARDPDKYGSVQGSHAWVSIPFICTIYVDILAPERDKGQITYGNLDI